MSLTLFLGDESGGFADGVGMYRMGWFNRGKEEQEPTTSTVVFERRDVE